MRRIWVGWGRAGHRDAATPRSEQLWQGIMHQGLFFMKSVGPPKGSSSPHRVSPAPSDLWVFGWSPYIFAFASRGTCRTFVTSWGRCRFRD